MSELKDYLEEAARDGETEKAKTVSLTGATRVSVPEHFHYICPELERRVAMICAEGHKAYEDTEISYAELSTGRKGLPMANLSKHARRHWNMFWRGDRSEDHLAKVAWAIAQIMHQQKDPQCEHFNMLLQEQHRIPANAQKPEGF